MMRGIPLDKFFDKRDIFHGRGEISFAESMDLEEEPVGIERITDDRIEGSEIFFKTF